MGDFDGHVHRGMRGGVPWLSGCHFEGICRSQEGECGWQCVERVLMVKLDVRL